MSFLTAMMDFNLQLARLKSLWQWILGAVVAILGIILLTKRSGHGHQQSATRSAAGAEEHKEMADIALEQAKSEAKTAEQHHLDAEQAAVAPAPDIPISEAVKRAKRGRIV